MKLEANSLNLNKLLYLIFKRKTIIAGLFAIILVFSFIAAFFITPKYKVYTNFLFDFEEEKTSVSPLAQKSQLLSLANKINSEKEIFKSPVIIESVVKEYPNFKKELSIDQSKIRKKFKDSLKGFFSFFGKFKSKKKSSPKRILDIKVKYLSEILKLKQVPNSNVLLVSMYVANPKFGVQVLDTYLKYYIKHRTAIEKFPGAPNFFNEQTSKANKRLQELEDNLLNFQQKERIIDYGKEVARISAKLGTYDMALVDIRRKIILGENDLAEIKNNLLSDMHIIPSISLFKNPILDKLYRKRIDLQLQLVNLKQKYKDQDPLIIAATKEIQMVEDELRLEVNKIIALMGSNLNKLRLEEKALESVMHNLKQQFKSLPQKGKIIRKLKRDIENENTTLTNLVQKKNQEMVSATKDNRLENIKLITPTTYSTKDKKPRKMIVLLIGTFLGLLFGIGSALTQEYFDKTFSNEDEVSDYMGVPVLVSIKEIK